MSRFGIFPFVGAGHLNPLNSLGRQLAAHGHHVTVFQMPLARAAVRAAGLKFCPIQAGPDDLPAPAKRPKGNNNDGASRLALFRRSIASVEAIKANAQRVLRSGPKAVRATGVEALIVDQHDLAAGSVAEFLGLPFVTIALSPPIYLNDSTPLSSFDWRYHTGPVARLRNRLGNALASSMIRPALSIVNRQRRQWGLQELRDLNDAFSKLAIITQLPESLDFPFAHRPAHIIYSGPFHDGKGRPVVNFPWERLDGRPLVYASMGTILMDMPWIFHTIAEACAPMRVQLVLSLGGGELMPEDLPALPGNPLIVHYAPQIEVLRRASLVVTHAGLNTTLEALAQGIPLIAIPIANDQPGVARRIERAGAGAVVPLGKLTAKRLKKLIEKVLEDPAYRQAAQKIKDAIEQGNGLEFAVKTIERVLAPPQATSMEFAGTDSAATGD